MTLTMLEHPGMLGWLAAALLFAGIAAWVKLGRGPMLRKLNGRAVVKTGQVKSASWLLVIALGVSVVAAIVAVASLIMP